MFVVMTVGASEADVLGVKSHILGEGMTPYDHAGPERIVIAVVGDIGPLKQSPGQSSREPARRRDGHPDLPTVQADLARVPSRGHRHPGARRGDRRRIPDDDGRPVLDRESRSAVRDGRRRQGCGCHDPARGRLQAADEPVRVPGPWRRGAPVSGRGPGADRPARHHRGDGAIPGRHRGRVRGHPPDRHPQHAELLAAS